MKSIAKFFAVGALAVSFSAHAEDTENFNPVRDRLEEKGLLKTLVDSKKLSTLCTQLYLQTTEFAGPNQNPLNVAGPIYLCNAANDLNFRTVIFDAYLEEPQKYGAKDAAEAKEALTDIVTEQWQKQCQRLRTTIGEGTFTEGKKRALTEKEKSNINNNFGEVCAAYDLPLSSPETP